MKPKVVVTGGAGFIGSHLTDALAERGYAVAVVDNLVCGRRAYCASADKLFVIDISDVKVLTEVFADADTVFHLAALPRVQYSIDHPQETYKVNALGTIRALVAAHQAKIRRFIFASSSSVYGDQPTLPLHEDMKPNPLSPYAEQKRIGEHYCALFADPRLYGLSTVALRFFNVYGSRLDPEGPYALVIGKFLAQRQRGEPLTIYGDGEQTRDFTHVSDVVRACVLAMTSSIVGAGEVINIGSGNPVSINRIAQLIGGPVVHGDPRGGEPRHTHADNTRARQLLGWQPSVNIATGIADLRGT